MSTTNGQPLLDSLLAFARALREVGVPVSLQQELDFLRALELVNIGNREQVFFGARSQLISSQDHYALFELLFNQLFNPSSRSPRPQKAPIAPRHQPRQRPFDITTYLAYKARLFDEGLDVSDKVMTFSNAEVLQRKDFSLMTTEELDTLRRLIQTMKWDVTSRRTRRRQAARRGETLHLRKILREAARHNGVPVRLVRQARKVKQRPIVLLADISGSMEKYARVMLLFFHSIARRFNDVQSFVFGTRLTCITPQLRLKNVDRAIDEASHGVADWSGGTRIGESLRVFNVRWSRRVLRRGAIAIIVSDGWERGDCSLLTCEVRYLQHRCHRLIWLNPLSGQTNYLPRVEGMQAALPYIDDFLPVHNLESLIDLNKRLASLAHTATR